MPAAPAPSRKPRNGRGSQVRRRDARLLARCLEVLAGLPRFIVTHDCIHPMSKRQRFPCVQNSRYAFELGVGVEPGIAAFFGFDDRIRDRNRLNRGAHIVNTQDVRTFHGRDHRCRDRGMEPLVDW